MFDSSSMGIFYAYIFIGQNKKAQGETKKKPFTYEGLKLNVGALDTIRTCDPLLRREMLCPAELQAQAG